MNEGHQSLIIVTDGLESRLSEAASALEVTTAGLVWRGFIGVYCRRILDGCLWYVNIILIQRSPLGSIAP